MSELTAQEHAALRAIKRLEKIWPKTMTLFVDDQTLYVIRTNPDARAVRNCAGRVFDAVSRDSVLLETKLRADFGEIAGTSQVNLADATAGSVVIDRDGDQWMVCENGAYADGSEWWDSGDYIDAEKCSGPFTRTDVKHTMSEPPPFEYDDNPE